LRHHIQFIQKEVYKYNFKNTTTLANWQLKFATTLIYISVFEKILQLTEVDSKLLPTNSSTTWWIKIRIPTDKRTHIQYPTATRTNLPPTNNAYGKLNKKSILNRYLLKWLNDSVHVNDLGIIRFVRKIYVDSPYLVGRHFFVFTRFRQENQKTLTSYFSFVWNFHTPMNPNMRTHWRQL